MNPTSIWPVFITLIPALLALFFLCRTFRKRALPVKFLSIDGLRGYLAFFVFLHHTSIYFFWLPKSEWALPPSNLYSQLGSASVSLFFMITSFLFFTKLIEEKKKPVDWLRLFVSRILRLYSVYILALLICLLYIGIHSHFTLNVPVTEFLAQLGQWLLFTVFDNPMINGVGQTHAFLLSVLWTIKYEWLFYFCLPLTGLVFFKSKPSGLILLISMFISFVMIWYSEITIFKACIFIGGIAAAFLNRSEKVRKVCATHAASLIIISCIALLLYFFDSAYDNLPLILLSVAFIVIACGNSFFGLLSNRLSRELGQLSYCIYLLHPLLLYFVMGFCPGTDKLVKLSVLSFWLLMSVAGAGLVTICFFVHHYFELPALKATEPVTAFIRKRILRKKQQW